MNVSDLPTQALLHELERRGVLSWRFRWNGSTERMRLVSAWEPASDELADTVEEVVIDDEAFYDKWDYE